MEYLDKENLKNILIVDDSSTSRMIIKRCFEISGIDNSKYYYAGNGLEALDIIKNRKIDLIITDINMPKMDGFNLIKKLKSEETSKNIPIVVTSSMSGSSTLDELLEMGVKWIIKKPVVPKKIIEIFGE